MLLQAFYSVCSERQPMEQLDFNLLFRWFVGLGINDPVWDASTFSKNRDRLLDGSVAAAFLSAVLAIPRVNRRDAARLGGKHLDGQKADRHALPPADNQNRRGMKLIG